MSLVFCIGLAIFYRDRSFLVSVRSSAVVTRAPTSLSSNTGTRCLPAPPRWRIRRCSTPQPEPLDTLTQNSRRPLPYAVIRFLGADPFLAFQLMGFTQNMIGFAAMFALARYQIVSPLWLAAAAGFTIAFANSVHAQVMHMQILTVNYYPVILLFLVGAAMQLKRN